MSNQNKDDFYSGIDSTRINRTYKDSIFRYIFSNPNEFTELYHSITGITLDENSIESMNLDSLVISDWHNDVSFVTKDQHIIILVEQQSTICKNMTIRCLAYYFNLISKLYSGNYQKFKQKIYTDKIILLPEPEFYVLYLGSEPLEKNIELLSEHFHSRSGENIDVKVHIRDINYPCLSKDTSNALLGYSFITEQFRKHYKNLKLVNLEISEKKKQALQQAIEDCKQKGYLLDYLDRREFLIMANDDFTLNEYVVALQERFEEKGLEKGMQKGMQKGMEKGIEKGLQMKAFTIAENMLKKGYDIEEISNITGLSTEEIKNI